MEKLIDFLNNSISPYHAVINIEKILVEAGFSKLKESESWNLVKGGSYYVIKDQTSIIAFKISENIDSARFNIVATHTDSPCFKIKPNGLISNENYSMLNTEVYGGLIQSSWLDRPLGIAGRVVVKNGNCYESKVVSTNEDILVIPNTCPHLNPEINNGFKYNPQVDLLPLFTGNEKFKSVYDYLKIDNAVSSDLYIYNPMKAQLVGANKEFILSSRIDNLECTCAGLYSFVSANNNDSINVLACFNNEEIGSSTKQGAGSNLMEYTLKKIMLSLGYDETTYMQALNNSVIVSADNAHSVHPNHPELSDPTNKVFMNKGVVIKRNANERYTTDAISEAIMINACEKAGVPYQYYTNRSNQRGGGTLGAISSSKVSITSVDIGLAQLAMHSSTETAGVKDFEYMEKALKAFYESSFYLDDNNFIIK